MTLNFLSKTILILTLESCLTNCVLELWDWKSLIFMWDHKRSSSESIEAYFVTRCHISKRCFQVVSLRDWKAKHSFQKMIQNVLIFFMDCIYFGTLRVIDNSTATAVSKAEHGMNLLSLYSFADKLCLPELMILFSIRTKTHMERLTDSPW